jgi:hypothetical protein
VSPAPAARYLVDFGSNADGGLAASAAVAHPKLTVAHERPHLADVHAALSDAASRARDEARAAVASEHEERLAAERARHDDMLAAERARWCAEEGVRLGELLAAGLHLLEERIAESAAAVLRPFVDERRRAQSIEALRDAIRTLLAADKDAVLRVEGPEDLLEALRASTPPSGAAIDYAAADAVDVRIVAGDTVIASQLALWSERLEAGAP